MYKYRIFYIQKDNMPKLGTIINRSNPDTAAFDPLHNVARLEFGKKKQFDEVAKGLVEDFNIEIYSQNPTETKKIYDNIANDKKRNMEYWDELDNKTESFVQALVDESFDNKGFTHHINDEDRAYYAKRILEYATELLEKETNKKVTFPYVDTDY